MDVTSSRPVVLLLQTDGLFKRPEQIANTDASSLTWAIHYQGFQLPKPTSRFCGKIADWYKRLLKRALSDILINEDDEDAKVSKMQDTKYVGVQEIYVDIIVVT